MDSPSLDSLRQEIDAIDGELHGLIRRRADLVDRIAAAKPPGGLALRPGREAQVMRQRLATHQGPFPAAAVYRMWREMMCAFTLMQTPDLKIAICRPADQPGYWDLARDHFGCQIPFVANDTPAQVLAAVRANPSTLGVVPAPIEADAAPWWPLLAGRDATLPNVVARLPFLDMPNARARGISAFVLARMEPEDSRRRSRPDLGRGARPASAATASPAPWPRSACPPSLRRWTRLSAACITISSSCRA